MGVFIIHPRLPFCQSHYQQQGPFAPVPLQDLHHSYGPVRHPLAILPFPGDAGYRPDLLQRFLAGTRRASPVAQCVLVIVLSLTPRQSGSPHQSVCDAPCCLHPASKDSAFGASIFRGYFAFTSLRPDDLLTILKMALSIDESLVSLSPSIQATRLPDFYLGGLDSH